MDILAWRALWLQSTKVMLVGWWVSSCLMFPKVQFLSQLQIPAASSAFLQEALLQTLDLLPHDLPPTGDTWNAQSSQQGSQRTSGALGMRRISIRPLRPGSSLLLRIALRRYALKGGVCEMCFVALQVATAMLCWSVLRCLESSQVFRQVPHGELENRRQFQEKYGHLLSSVRRGIGAVQMPFLRDPNTGAEVLESADIVRYLYETYQDGAMCNETWLDFKTPVKADWASWRSSQKGFASEIMHGIGDPAFGALWLGKGFNLLPMLSKSLRT